MFGFSRARRRADTNAEPRVNKFQEKHIISAILGAATISVLCCSVAEPIWFQVHTSVCCYDYIGIAPFMHSTPIKFLPLPDEKCEGLSNTPTAVWKRCINDKTTMTVQVLASVVLLTILTSLFAFSLDIIAPRKFPFWKVVKRYAFGYILTVILCATSLGFSYWTSEEIYNNMFSVIARNGSKFELRVSFGMGVYLTTAAGCLSVFAVASNLMRQYPTAWEEQTEELALISEDENEDFNETDQSVEPPAYVP